jgi:hypothetical protein
MCVRLNTRNGKRPVFGSCGVKSHNCGILSNSKKELKPENARRMTPRMQVPAYYSVWLSQVDMPFVPCTAMAEAKACHNARQVLFQLVRYVLQFYVSILVIAMDSTRHLKYPLLESGRIHSDTQNPPPEFNEKFQVTATD